MRNLSPTHLAPLLLLALLCHAARAHPVPDVPVRASFGSDGFVTVRVEVDPRCFAPDPLNEPYLENASLRTLSEKKKNELFTKAAAFIRQFIEIHALPAGRVRPEFKMKFTTFQNGELVWNTAQPAANSADVAQTPVVVTAEWKTDASTWTSYQIKSSTNSRLSVVFANEVNGKAQPVNVLFPGEESHKLDLAEWTRGLSARPSGPDSEKPAKTAP